MTTAEQIAVLVDEDQASHPDQWQRDEEAWDVEESLTSLHDMLERFGFLRVLVWLVRLHDTMGHVEAQPMDQVRRG